MTNPASAFVIRAAAAALALAAMSACSPIEAGIGAAMVGPQAVTGRNTFYWIDKTFGRSCSDVSYFDRPVRCVNDRG